MSEAIRRNSKQRQLILDTLRSVHCHPTAEDVFQMVREKNPTISLGTVYRNLNAMCDEGEIFRIPVPGQPDHYDKNPVKHEHTYCRSCGELTDLLMPELSELLAQRCPGYTDYQLTVCTICESCRAAEANKQ